MNSLKNFVLTLGACFAVPTYFMVVRPYTSERERLPVPYVMEVPGSGKTSFDAPEQKGLYFPGVYSGDRKRGQEIYAQEGCAQCHTQVIRPDYAGIDQFKKGWGKDQNGIKLTVTRPTYMWDYLHEDFAMLGQRRIGPDLANAGYRFEGKLEGLTLASDPAKMDEQKAIGLNDLYLYLYAPRARKSWSNSPGFPHLFTVRAKEGAGAADALKLPADLSPKLAAELTPPAGMEIVPTSAARALASYILGLKRDAPLPVSISGAVVKPEAK